MSTRVRIGEVEVEGDHSLAELEAVALRIFETARKLSDTGLSLGFASTERSMLEPRARPEEHRMSFPPDGTPQTPQETYYLSGGPIW